MYGPGDIKNLINEAMEKRKQEIEEQKQAKEEEERLQKLEEDRVKFREEVKQRKRKQAQNMPKKTEEELSSYSVSAVKDGSGPDDSLRRPVNRPMTSGLWTDADLAELVRLVKKYPGGTTNRWETIADLMNRSVYEITHMAAKLKEVGYKVPGQSESPAEQILQNVSKKVKTRKPAEAQIQAAAESVWSQTQQQALEAAIIKYPKSIVGDRWQKISDHVQGKSKEECLARYKYLVELVKKQKQTSQESTEQPDDSKPSGEEEQPSGHDTKESTKKSSSNKKSKKKSTKIDSDKEDDDTLLEKLDDHEPTFEDLPVEQKGGTSKNKRKARKKEVEYVSYEDYEDSDLGNDEEDDDDEDQ